MTLPNGEQGVHEASVVVAKEEWQAMVDEQAKLRQKVADQEARIRDLVEYEKMYHAWNTLGGCPAARVRVGRNEANRHQRSRVARGDRANVRGGGEWRRLVTPGGSSPFRITFPEAIRRQLRDWAEEARQLGIEDSYRDALVEMVERLERDPLKWGDPLYQLRLLGVHVFRACATYFYVTYGVDSNRRIMYVTQVRAAPGQSFDRPENPPQIDQGRFSYTKEVEDVAT